MQIQSILIQMMDIDVCYKAKDLAGLTGAKIQQVRYALNHLHNGGIVTKDKVGRENVYMTKQGKLNV